MPEVHPLLIVAAVVAVGVALVKIGAWKGGVDEHKSTVVRFMERVEDKLDKIFDRVRTAQPLDTGSPLRLNELGEKISGTLDAAAWARREAGDLRPRVATKSPYDIQQFCFQYVSDEFKPDKEFDAAIKDCAFRHGASVGGVLDVLAIELRDILLGDQDPPE